MLTSQLASFFPTFPSSLHARRSGFYWGISSVDLEVENPGGESFPTFPSGGYAHVLLRAFERRPVT